ncbi:hypothetical protein BG004_007928 [Podila humilis]|nr:hypothetical protein BG004_007928 [Podila humilis]
MASPFTEEELLNYKESFDAFDRNKDGAINATELRALLKLVGEKVNTQVIADTMQEFDVNNDQQIDFQEFLQLVTKHLLLWNTGLGKDCQNLDVGEKICISGPQETKGSNSGKADIAAAAPAPRTANTATTGSTAGNTKPQVKGTTRPLYPNMMTKPAAATAAADGAGALKKQQSGQPTTNKLTNANSGGAKAESVRPAASAGPSPQHGSA